MSRDEEHGPPKPHSHGHSHSLAEGDAHFSPFARWIVIGLLAVVGLASVIGAAVLWPGDSDHPIPPQFGAANGGPIQIVDGEVVDQVRGDCLSGFSGGVHDTRDLPIVTSADGPCILNIVRLDEGDDAGKYTLLEVPTNRAQGGSAPNMPTPAEDALDDPQPGHPTLATGDAIQMNIVPGPEGANRYAFFDFQRGNATILWALLFVGAIVLVAAWRGLRSVVGLILAFAVLGFFTLPAILDGRSPVAVAVVSSAVILFAVLYLAHGISMRTSSALLGTLVSLLLAGLLSWAAIESMQLTGLSGDQITNLQMYQGSISVSGLLLAGFIIGALGVLNDVTITQASAAFELAGAGEPTRLATFKAAMRVGRDHIASTVYTLVFAYAGSALPLLLLFSVAEQPFGTLVTTDIVAVELARAFVGGIAIALSVPLTTAIAAALTTPGGTPPAREVPTKSAAPVKRTVPRNGAPKPPAATDQAAPVHREQPQEPLRRRPPGPDPAAAPRIRRQPLDSDGGEQPPPPPSGGRHSLPKD